MSVKSVPGTFTLDANGINIGDLQTSLVANDTVGRTAGATILTQPTLGGPTQSEKWTLQSVSIQATLLYAVTAATVSQVSTVVAGFGRFGKIKGFLIPGQSSQGVNTTDNNPGIFGGIPTPPVYDETLAGELWNPANNDMPPSVQVVLPNLGVRNPAKKVYPTYPLALGISISPPFPIRLIPGQPPTIGITMEPSLLGISNYVALQATNFGLFIANASFIVNYDDGT